MGESFDGKGEFSRAEEAPMSDEVARYIVMDSLSARLKRPNTGPERIFGDEVVHEILSDIPGVRPAGGPSEEEISRAEEVLRARRLDNDATNL